MKTVGGIVAKRGGVLPPLVLKREDDELVFRAQPVHDLDEFEALCPAPDFKKFGVLTPQGWQPDPEAPEYLDLLKTYRKRRWAYIVIKTLEPSNIEWEKVKLKDHTTWLDYYEELAAVLSYNELGHVMALIEEANALDQEKLEENRQSFFRKLAERQTLPNGQNGDQASSQSGTPVKDLASSHRE